MILPVITHVHTAQQVGLFEHSGGGSIKLTFVRMESMFEGGDEKVNGVGGMIY